MELHTSYIITGPTASGKSDFAHRLACRVNGTIINCDSVQIYRGIENISASPFAGRPISDEIDGVPYRLFSILDLSDQISVAEYLNMAKFIEKMRHSVWKMMRCGRNIINWNMKFFPIMIKVQKNWHGSKNWKNNWG